MAKSTRSKKRNKPGNYKTLIILFIVLVTIAIASVIISYFITNDKSDILSQKTEQSDQLQQDNIQTSLEGTWVSNYDGAILTITGVSFTIETPGVDDPTKTSGKLAIEQNLVTFINTGDEEVCKGTEGHYQFTFEKDEVSFKLIKDKCESRKERMTVSWFRL